MAGSQDLGIGGLAFLSTNDLSGLATNVSNGNNAGTTFLNGVGMGVTIDTSNANQIVLQTTTKAAIIGVLLNNPKALEAAQIGAVRGQSFRMWAGGTITAGQYLMMDSSARFIAATSSVVAIVGQACEAAVVNTLFQGILLDGYVA